MPKYRWTGKTRNGNTASGELEAPDSMAVREALKRAGIEVERCDEVASRQTGVVDMVSRVERPSAVPAPGSAGGRLRAVVLLIVIYAIAGGIGWFAWTTRASAAYVVAAAFLLLGLLMTAAFAASFSSRARAAVEAWTKRVTAQRDARQ